MDIASNSQQTIDRRTELRYGLECQVKCFKYCVMKESNLIEASIINASSNGLCLKISSSLNCNTNLCIRFDASGACTKLHSLPDNVERVLTISEVRWCRKGSGLNGSECYYAGVKHLTGDYD